MSLLSVFHLSFCSSFSVFLDLLPWKQTQERALLVQGEDRTKRPERSTERTLPQRENEEIPPKVSIPIPEEHKALKKCHLYSSAFLSPRVPFMMSFLLVLALAVWWLIFLWLENRGSSDMSRLKPLNSCLWLELCNCLHHASGLDLSLLQGPSVVMFPVDNKMQNVGEHTLWGKRSSNGLSQPQSQHI